MKTKQGTRWVEWANDRCTAQMRHELAEEIREAMLVWQGKSAESTDPEVTQAFERWQTLTRVHEFLSPTPGDDDADK